MSCTSDYYVQARLVNGLGGQTAKRVWKGGKKDLMLGKEKYIQSDRQ